MRSLSSAYIEKIFFVLLFVLLALRPAEPVFAEEPTYFDITASEVRKIMVAAPAFSGNAADQGAAGATASKLITQAFELYSFIHVLEYGSYGGRKDADWNALGVDYVVMGQINGDAAGIALEGQIMDVGSNSLLPGRRFKGSPAQLEDMALRLADGLIEDLTGEMGAARTRIAYISDASGKKEVYLSDILGRHPRQVTRHRALCVSPRFSPDGNELAYSTYHRGNQDLYITDLRQNAQTTSISRRPGMNLAPAFTPNGNLIVTLSTDGNPDLYLIDRRGNILDQLTSRAGINVSPAVSPDGQTLAFASDRSRTGHPKVYLMDIASRQTRLLQTSVAECSEPAWSPKGDEIAFTGLAAGGYQVFVADRNGGNVRQLTSGGNYESPSWAPDGRLIAVTRKGGGRSQICVVSKNGKDVRVLLNMRGNLSFPQWSPRLP